ncbi:MAG: SRPBCC family protein [Acidimicrobiales bacterium]|nr:SRPBCC family protein [Acidimicrobiales bacterium]
MDVTATLAAPCDPATLFAWVEDLARYPAWLDIVPRATSVEADAGDPGPAWSVDLRGRLGPLARSKRLRMVRTVDEAPTAVRFERREVDGRHHAAWVLRADVGPAGTGSRLTMHLHYGGSLWGPLIERMLGDEIERSRPRLLALVAGGPAEGPGQPSGQPSG